MNTALVALLLVSLVLMTIGFIRPTVFAPVFKSKAKRAVSGGLFALLSVIIFILIGLLNMGNNNAKVITKPTTDQDVIYGRLFEGAWPTRLFNQLKPAF